MTVLLIEGSQQSVAITAELGAGRDTVAALTEVDNVGMAMMVNNAIAAMNFFMTSPSSVRKIRVSVCRPLHI
jgi:hypothetical protein